MQLTCILFKFGLLRFVFHLNFINKSLIEGMKKYMSMKLAKYIDHTLLKAEATVHMIDELIEEAKQYSFASVCVNPCWVKHCSEQLQATDVAVCTVVGFPLGATTTATKVFETKQALKDGATEIDMVMNIGSLKARNNECVQQDIKDVVNATKGKALVKVIIETALLTEKEIIEASRLVKQAGADFIKTSTGFSSSGARVSDIQLMRSIVGEDIGVKASGGIRSLADARAMIKAGATRIGASAGVSIMKEYGDD